MSSLYLPSGIDRSASFFRGANGENYNLDKHLGRGACTRDAHSIDPPPSLSSSLAAHPLSSPIH